MGVGITELVPKRNIRMEELSGKMIAIDSMNILYQFLSTIRQYDGTPLMDSKGRITSHLSGLFYRTCRMLESGIKPVYVFDGKPPGFKLVGEERRKTRENAREMEKQARERGDIEEAYRWSKQGVKIDDYIIQSSKDLLERMGMPWIQAPSEGEAQASYMARKGKVWAVSSQDYDCLLFGAPRLLRNIAVSSKKKVMGKYVDVLPEIMELENVLDSLEIKQKQLIMLGLLVGTDFNPGGVKGYGPKKALEYVKEHRDLSEFPWPWYMSVEDLVDFFENPPVTDDYELKWKKIDESSVKEMMCKEHQFSEERIQSSIDRVKEAKPASSLSKWMK